MLGLILQATISSTWFELRRTVSGQKLFMGAILVLFPPFIMYMVFRMSGQQVPPELVLAILLWMTGLLSLILWLPPGVYSELEGQTWILSTSRPYGRVSMLLGKYFSAIIWTILVMSISYAVTTTVCFTLPDQSFRANAIPTDEAGFTSPDYSETQSPAMDSGTKTEAGFFATDENRSRVNSYQDEVFAGQVENEDTEQAALDEQSANDKAIKNASAKAKEKEAEKKSVPRINLAQFAPGFFQVSVLAALAYGAVFSLLSVVALKRAMGFAVGYVIVSEVLLASVPAMVQKFTVRYHLQSLGLNCISDFGLSQLEDGGVVTNLVLNDPLPLSGNYLSLGLGSLLILALTIAIANRRQLITVHEG